MILPTRQEKEKLNGHQGLAIWLTGLPASGKSTLALHVVQELLNRNYTASVLDSDVLQLGLCSDLDYSPGSRSENIRRAGEVAKLLVNTGSIVVTAFISPYLADRSRLRALLGKDCFYEVFLSCLLDICEKRDPKGLYRKAGSGLITSFTRITAPYEVPKFPDLVIPAGQLDSK